MSSTWDTPPPSFDRKPDQSKVDGLRPGQRTLVWDSVISGSMAGVDPRLVLAIALEEAADQHDDDGTLHDLNQWQRGRIPWIGRMNNPAGYSLGITNVKERTFEKVKEKYPSVFHDHEWSDLATDDALAVRTTAYYLKYLQETYAGAMPDEIKQKYTLNQFLASAYNAEFDADGDNNVLVWIKDKNLGQGDSKDYRDRVKDKQWRRAESLLSTMWTWQDRSGIRPISATLDSPDQPAALLNSWLIAGSSLLDSILRPARGAVPIAGGMDPNPNRQTAVKYADDWAIMSNWEYPSYDASGGDCTSFASQVLHAGGFQFDPSRADDSFAVTDRWHPYNRKYNHIGTEAQHEAGDSAPRPWLNVQGLYSYIANGYGNANGGPTGTRLAPISVNPITGNPDPNALTNAGLRPGDLVFVSFGEKNKDGSPLLSHTMVYAGHGNARQRIGEDENGNPRYQYFEDADFVDYHSSNVYHGFWAIPKVDEDTEKVVTDRTVTYYPVRMNYPGDAQYPVQRAAGGDIRGPGSSIGDKIPAWLSDGEFVMNARSTSVNRPFLQALNADPFFLQKMLVQRDAAAAARANANAGGYAQAAGGGAATVNISMSSSEDIVARLKVLSTQWELMNSR
ncbi:amidase domain-containing protein [Nocardia xishanensis]